MAGPDDFKWAHAFVRRWEKGDHRPTLADPNPTRDGITQRFYDALVRKYGYPVSSVFLLTKETIDSIYERVIWRDAHGPDLPRLVAACHYDCSVNMSRPRATRILQRALGITADGLWGPETQYAAVSAKQHEAVKRMCGWRECEYTELVAYNKRLAPNLPGWLNRVRALREYLGVG